MIIKDIRLLKNILDLNFKNCFMCSLIRKWRSAQVYTFELVLRMQTCIPQDMQGDVQIQMMRFKRTHGSPCILSFGGNERTGNSRMMLT